jgi:hypothetical protein
VSGEDDLVHVRARAPRRGYTRTPKLLQAIARAVTLCGAEPTTRDLGFRDAHSAKARPYITCPACLAALENAGDAPH